MHILARNIEHGSDDNFRVAEAGAEDSLATPYDYCSIMHYGSRDRGARGGDGVRRVTVVARRPVLGCTMGRAARMSRWDVERINRLYQCV